MNRLKEPSLTFSCISPHNFMKAFEAQYSTSFLEYSLNTGSYPASNSLINVSAEVCSSLEQNQNDLSSLPNPFQCRFFVQNFLFKFEFIRQYNLGIQSNPQNTYVVPNVNRNQNSKPELNQQGLAHLY